MPTAYKKDILFAAGRMVMGSIYEPQTTDQDGNPLVVKTGANKGQPTQKYFFAVAIPKIPGHTHWGHTEWGAIIWAVGHQCWPQGQADQPGFAWKIVDGDSQVPNKKQVRPCDREGYPGHWVISFTSQFPPKLCDANGDPAAHLEIKGAIKLGYWVQVLGSVDGNERKDNAGVYLNHSAVSLQGYDKEITLGLDTRSVGFGKGVALPPGASTTPIGAANPAAMASVPMGATLAPVPGIPGPVVPAGLPPIPGATPAQTTVTPHPGILPPVAATTPAVALPPPVVVTPPVVMPPPVVLPPARALTPKAGGATYEQLVSVGWTDALLIQQGLMLP